MLGRLGSKALGATLRVLLGLGLAACALPAADLVGGAGAGGAGDAGGAGGQGGDACPGAEPPLLLQPVADATLDESELATPHGDAFELKVRSGDLLQRALLQFALGGVPTGATICRATLELTPVMPVSGPLEIGYHRATMPWVEAQVTWGTQADAYGAESAHLLLEHDRMEPYYADLTADARAMFASPGANFGWLVKARSEAGAPLSTWVSSRTGSSPPVLQILFSVP
ncbi:MAG: DNRLRE domain-containing protein [Myxococcales bacterium]|nr:DNRLRE domain-containing protein [Myxococcales bacterium]